MQFPWTVIPVVLLSVGAFANAHAADPVVTDAEKLKESLAKWMKAREECGGDYSYVVSWSSAFGFGHRTTITVKGNKVVERKYEEFGRPEPVKPGEKPVEPKPKWVETEKDLGSHKPEGVAVRTVDELYAEAAKLLEMKVPESHRRYLGFDKQGLLNYCFTVDSRIADDAPRKGVGPIQIQLKPKK